MKVATILPTAYLSMVQDDDYHLCLAQLIDTDEQYTTFYTRAAQDGKFVILDNGAAEGIVAPIEELYEKSLQINASELVLPDVFFNSNGTIAAVHGAMDYLTKVGYKGRVMAVPQGRSLREWLVCALEIMHMGVHTIGVPKNLVHTEGPEGRYKAIGGLLHLRRLVNNIMIEVHLLGCWTDPREVGMIYNFCDVRGVDSRLPYLYAAEGWLLDPDKYDKPPKKNIDFGENVVDRDLLWQNIKRWRGYCLNELQ